MPLRDFLKKKDKIEENGGETRLQSSFEPTPFKIMRSDTNTEEILDSPTIPASPKGEKSPGLFRRASNTRDSPGKEHKSLSDVFHIHRNKSSSGPSSYKPPANMPEIQGTYNERADKDETEARWEERATLLANANKSPGLAAASAAPEKNSSQLSLNSPNGRPRSVSDARSDVTLQEAIRLHEEGQYPEATAMFKQLADQGNVLSEVLYGLALRHGWGCNKDEKAAFTYLAHAASDSAALEAEALKAGLKKGGAAKGELVLAIFELGNCYRYGWGTGIDKPAAR